MIALKTIRTIDFTDKRVLLRVDYNVLLDEKKDAHDTYKLSAAKETIEFILSHRGARIALLSHRGRPKGVVNKDLTMSYLSDDIERIIARKVFPVCDATGVCVYDALNSLEEGQLILLENVRFDAGEQKNDDLYAQQLAAPFDIYVNDAFSVCHRAHASVHAITKYLPSYAGLWLRKEVKNLTRIKEAKAHPAVAIIGGAKIDTKMPLIASFEETYDKVLVGGRVAVEAQEQDVTFSDKVVLPSDYAQDMFDIGPVTVGLFGEILCDARTIVWNGPMGKFEEEPFNMGTRAIAEFIAQNTEAYSVVGGGESVQAIADMGYMDKISFVSTGGGAMLAFLSGDDMPGLTVLIEA